MGSIRPASSDEVVVGGSAPQDSTAATGSIHLEFWQPSLTVEDFHDAYSLSGQMGDASACVNYGADSTNVQQHLSEGLTHNPGILEPHRNAVNPQDLTLTRDNITSIGSTYGRSILTDIHYANGSSLSLSDNLRSDETNRSLETPPFNASPTQASNYTQGGPMFDTTELFSPAMPITRHGFTQGLPRRRSIYYINKSNQAAEPVFIPSTGSPLDPLTRWQASPPEDEPAEMSAIRDAIHQSWSYSADHEGSNAYGPQVGISGPELQDPFQGYRLPSRAASTTSAESAASASSRQSGRSGLSGGSHDSRVRKSTTRARKTQTRAKKDKSVGKDDHRPFCCTFCCDTFKNKYDWMRHEKSLHLNLESWVCAPFGGTVIMPSTNRVHCAYCSMLDPTPDHLAQHNHGACDGQQRTFRRKDHLVQHLRLVHRLEVLPLIQEWRIQTANFTSHCGFCAAVMTSWDERCNHLAIHFRNGSTMADWKGDHGFPPSIEAQVTNAVPPYMLDYQSHTIVPFSATNNEARDHFSQMLSRVSFPLDANIGTGHTVESAELPSLVDQLHMKDPDDTFALNPYTKVLTLHLSHYATEQARLGVVPTDEMFQQEARRLLYDSVDPWDQTVADHPQWLADFRRELPQNGSIRNEEDTDSFEVAFNPPTRG